MKRIFINSLTKSDLTGRSPRQRAESFHDEGKDESLNTSALLISNQMNEEQFNLKVVPTFKDNNSNALKEGSPLVATCTKSKIKYNMASALFSKQALLNQSKEEETPGDLASDD